MINPKLKELEEKEAKIKERLKSIQKNKRLINQREADNKRKAQTRCKILFGAVIINKSSQEQLKALTEEMSDKDKKYVTEHLEAFNE